MRPNSSQLRMIGLRVVLAGAAGVGTVGALQLTAFLALAALDGGRELPTWAAYGIPIVSSILLPILPMNLGLSPKGRWNGAPVGLGSGVGSTVAIVTAAHLDGSMAWPFALSAVGALVGTFAWVPWLGSAGVPAGDDR
jgi:hypothetical protein